MTDTTNTENDTTAEDSAPPLLQRLAGWIKPGQPETSSVRETIEELIEEQPDSDEAIGEHERVLLANVLKQRNATVAQIMVPRTDIKSVEVTTPVPDVIRLLVEAGHSRVPVYRDSLDEVIGMVHIKDLAAGLLNVTSSDAPMDLKASMRRVIFAAPAARVLDLLLEMRLKRTHMAMVIDEYGGIDGLVTIEDLVEQIVGDISDEHDSVQLQEITDRKDGAVDADARVTLTEFIDRYGPLFTDEEQSELDTLGGLVFKLAGRVPNRGELVSHPSGMEFEIVDADPRRIRKLRIRNIPSDPLEHED